MRLLNMATSQTKHTVMCRDPNPQFTESHAARVSPYLITSLIWSKFWDLALSLVHISLWNNKIFGITNMFQRNWSCATEDFVFTTGNPGVFCFAAVTKCCEKAGEICEFGYPRSFSVYVVSKWAWFVVLTRYHDLCRQSSVTNRMFAYEEERRRKHCEHKTSHASLHSMNWVD